ncbi:hypothetical protein BDF19DRAFT_75624 [Syncephalis fuscata]|nr:hypothetical protein BDF19DRAFT_75624 [Syncephalis fuscata]
MDGLEAVNSVSIKAAATAVATDLGRILVDAGISTNGMSNSMLRGPLASDPSTINTHPTASSTASNILLNPMGSSMPSQHSYRHSNLRPPPSHALQPSSYDYNSSSAHHPLHHTQQQQQQQQYQHQSSQPPVSSYHQPSSLPHHLHHSHPHHSTTTLDGIRHAASMNNAMQSYTNAASPPLPSRLVHTSNHNNGTNGPSMNTNSLLGPVPSHLASSLPTSLPSGRY